MLTPSFSLEQDTKYLTVFIKAPLTKVSEAEVYVDGNEFKFYSKPYYLRLNLPGEIKCDSENAKYLADEGTFVIRVEKENPGEHFDGLDLLTKLLAPTGKSAAAGPLIEVIEESNDDKADENPEDSDDEEEEEFDWQIEQEVFNEEEKVSLEAPRYGFAGKRQGVLGRLQDELHDVIDLKDADKVPMRERRSLRMEDEQQHFSDDHYLADLYEDDAVRPLLKYKHPWMAQMDSCAEDKVKLTDEENEKLIKLPRKEHLLCKTEEKRAMFNLVDIMFAYAYDQRINEGDSNVESPWTICKISGTLSWFEVYRNLEDVLTTCFRRCLSYPLHRHYKLAKKVIKDTVALFKMGRRRLLKSLLHVHSILQSGDNTYILNDLYVTDYCIWIQHVREKRIRAMANALEKAAINKGDLGLDLVELERAAAIAIEEQESSQKTEDKQAGASSNQLSSDDVRSEDAKDPVSEAAAAVEGLHITNPHASDEASEEDLQKNGHACRCDCPEENCSKQVCSQTAGETQKCKYYIKRKQSENSTGKVPEVKQSSGTEDSSVSSDSDTSESSSESSSTETSDSEESETEEENEKSCESAQT